MTKSKFNCDTRTQISVRELNICLNTVLISIYFCTNINFDCSLPLRKNTKFKAEARVTSNHVAHINRWKK